MAIPFIQNLGGDKRVALAIERPGHIENLAKDFTDAGGRYLLEILTEGEKTGQVHVMAIIDTPKGCEMVAEETAPNGPPLPLAIDKMVTASHAHLPPSEMVRRPRLFMPAPANAP